MNTFKFSTRKHPKGYAGIVLRITGKKFDSLMYYKVFKTRHQARTNAAEVHSLLENMEKKLQEPKKTKIKRNKKALGFHL